eukprot:m.342575 g.342575  ORF g.342575 m.342575 type:complete len:338 (-) comp21580_c0_seq1:78-1091(-)
MSWRRVETENNILCRSSHGVSVSGDTLVVFGGENVARTPINSDVHLLHLATSGNPSWDTVSAATLDLAPPPRVAHAQACIDGKIYVFGGRQGITMEEAPLNDMYCFNITEKKWVAVEYKGGEPPCPRSFHKMIAVGSTLFVFGGCGAEGRLSDMYSFDTTTNEWKCILENGASLSDNVTISGRGGPGFVGDAEGNFVSVVGGFSGKEMNDIFRYSLENKTWEQVYTNGNSDITPFSVSCSGVLKSGSSKVIAFFGGEIAESRLGHEGAGAFSDDVLLLDSPSCKKLESKLSSGSGPQPRGWTDAAVWGSDKLVVFGGLTGTDENPTRLDDLWVFSLE